MTEQKDPILLRSLKADELIILEALQLTVRDLRAAGWAADQVPDGAGRWKLITNAPPMLVRLLLGTHGSELRGRQ